MEFTTRIKTITKEIRALVMDLNMEFEELVEWLIRENNNTLPWEEQSND